MDDGGLHKSGVKISTYCFELDHIKNLQIVLQTNFGIKSSIWTKKEGYIIYIPKIEINKLISIIKPFMLASMYYKVVK